MLSHLICGHWLWQPQETKINGTINHSNYEVAEMISDHGIFQTRVLEAYKEKYCNYVQRGGGCDRRTKCGREELPQVRGQG